MAAGPDASKALVFGLSSVPVGPATRRGWAERIMADPKPDDPAVLMAADGLVNDRLMTVDQMVARVQNRALFVIVSDFLMPLDELRGAMARLSHRGHDAMLVQVLDRQELRFEIDTPALFEGLEGEAGVEADPRAVRSAYLELLRAHVDGVDRIARGFGADALVCDTHEAVGPVLAALLDRRMSFAGRRGG
jgi:uncharacterized protein (DUF58 family)